MNLYWQSILLTVSTLVLRLLIISPFAYLSRYFIQVFQKNYCRIFAKRKLFRKGRVFVCFYGWQIISLRSSGARSGMRRRREILPESICRDCLCTRAQWTPFRRRQNLTEPATEVLSRKCPYILKVDILSSEQWSPEWC